jgi:hypothetical protein
VRAVLAGSAAVEDLVGVLCADGEDEAGHGDLRIKDPEVNGPALTQASAYSE